MVKMQVIAVPALLYCTLLYPTLLSTIAKVHAVQSEIPIQCISADQGFLSVLFNKSVNY